VDVSRLSVEVPRVIGERAASEHLGSELMPGSVDPAGDVVPSSPSRPDETADGRPAPRAIILPTPRLATNFEIEHATA
jgi:hypothetical protein